MSPSTLILWFTLLSVGNARKRARCYDQLCPQGYQTPTLPTAEIIQLLQQEAIERTLIEPAEEILKTRSVEFDSRENLCGTVRKTFIPFFDRNNNLTIVNVKGHYEQVLNFEICNNKKSKCLNYRRSPNYQTSCKQVYQNVRLMYVDHDRKIKHKLFSNIPNTCLCTWRKITHLS